MNDTIVEQKLELKIIVKEIFSTFDIYFNRLGFKYGSKLKFNNNLQKHSLKKLAFQYFGNKSSVNLNYKYQQQEDSKSITSYIICDFQNTIKTLQNKKTLITNNQSRIKLTHVNAPTRINKNKYIENKNLKENGKLLAIKFSKTLISFLILDKKLPDDLCINKQSFNIQDIYQHKQLVLNINLILSRV
jgi:hypothetical protein